MVRRKEAALVRAIRWRMDERTGLGQHLSNLDRRTRDP